MIAAIEVRNLRKTFKIRKKSSGIGNFFKPEYHEIEAVKNLSFTLNRGERVAFVGPNGAGKSTTIKILSGILYPDSGDVLIEGLTPWADRRKLAHKIGTVFGQRSQLWYHLPAQDTFNLLTYAYELDPVQSKKRIGELIESFDARHIVDKPVRQLSLGERMRCEIIASLIHKPAILFLDEPTVGLDVVSKGVIRELIKRASDDHGTTVLLTSHDTGDMERVCQRVIVIDHGELVIDKSVNDLRRSYIQEKILTLSLREEHINMDVTGVRIIEQSPYLLKLLVDTAVVSVEHVLQRVMQLSGLDDLTVEDPPTEEIIKHIYDGKIL